MVKRVCLVSALAATLVLTGCVVTATASVPRTVVRTETRVKVVEPPAVVVTDEAELVVIPDTYVYWLDGHDGVFFYGGVWWREWDGYWYRADVYSGPWIRIEVRHVPRPVWGLPHDWKQRRYDAPRVYWNDTRSHWRGWENDRYWEKRKWKKEPPHPGPKYKK